MSAVNHFIKKGIRQAEVDEFLSKELSRAGYGGVEITKTPLGERIIIHASKPGVVIGRRGKTIRTLTSELVAKYGFDDPKIDVKEVENPELNSKVMAYSLVSAIERGVHRRRAAYSVLRRVMNAGAKGCEIIIAGKLTSKRSRHEAYRMGLVAKSGEIGSKYVRSSIAIAVMKLGIVGVTVNIMRGDIPLPDEISVLSVNLTEDAEETVVLVEDEVKKEITPEKAKIAEKEIPKEKVEKKEVEEVKKEPKEVKKEPTAKKTDLDMKVEELSDLIEKTPSEAKKAKLEPKPVKKDTPAVDKTKAEKKPATKKALKEVKPAEKTTELKAKTTKKEEPKAKSTTKKTTPTKKSTTTKSTTTKKKETKKEAESKSKTAAAKQNTKSKTTKSEKDAKKK